MQFLLISRLLRHPFLYVQGNDPEAVDSKTIFESNGKLAFVHHKRVVIISNFVTSVSSMFRAQNVSGYIFDIESNEKKW